MQLLLSMGPILEGSPDFIGASFSPSCCRPLPLTCHWQGQNLPVSAAILKLVLHIFQWYFLTLLWFFFSWVHNSEAPLLLLLPPAPTGYPLIFWDLWDTLSSSFVINVIRWFLVLLSWCSIFMWWFGETGKLCLPHCRLPRILPYQVVLNNCSSSFPLTWSMENYFSHPSEDF